MIHLDTTIAEGLHVYQLFYLASILAGIVIAGYAARKSQFSYRDFALVLAIVLFCVLVAGKLFVYDNLQWKSFFSSGDLADESGKSILGVLVGGLFGCWLAGKLTGRKESVTGLFALALPIGMAIQRMGCLFSGCCHGTLTSVPWGITYGPGSKVFLWQQQLGMIPYDAAASLPIHPNQLYIVIACLAIAWIVWKTRPALNSATSGTILVVILYLAIRFFEEFIRYRAVSPEWLGVSMIQWKILTVLVVASLLWYRNEQSKSRIDSIVQKQDRDALSARPRIFFFTGMLILACVRLQHWFSNDEYAVLVFAVLPLSGFVLLDLLYQEFSSRNLLKYSGMLLLSILLMSQKQPYPEPDTAESYTAFNVSYLSGKFDRMEDINCHQETDCDGNVYEACDKVQIHHDYDVGGFGVERKAVYNKWQSTTTSLHFYIGSENSSSPDSKYSQTIYGISPRVQYDGRGFGAGLGLSVGVLGFDKTASHNEKPVFDPSLTKRNTSLQLRLRFFSERYVFLESLLGYESGAMGLYTSQFLIGSRFNTVDKYMLKLGLQSSYDHQTSFVLIGQLPISRQFYVYPEFSLWDNNDIVPSPTSIRTSVKLQYRLGQK